MRLVLDVDLEPEGGLNTQGEQRLGDWLEREDAVSLIAWKPGLLMTPFASLRVRSMRVLQD